MRNRLLQLLNVRDDEAWLVKNLFYLQFFQGMGIALFFTVSNALFLQEFSVTELPKVYIFSAFLLWFTGWAYSKFEHAVSVKTLVLGVVLFMAASVLAFRLGFFISSHWWFYFLLLAWFNVLYLLSNLEFWGLSALMFDIRQSKRLFGMIGAGDIPAKFIGYLTVPILVPFLGSENMLVLAFAAILTSVIFWYRLEKAGKLEIHVKHEHHAHASAEVKDIIDGFFGSKLIATLAVLSFIVVTCATIINFSFYAEIKEKLKDDEQLAAFIGLFLAGGRIVAIFIKLIFTGRVANALGTRGSLLITPMVLAFFVVFIFFMPVFTANQHWVLYIFGIMAILTEILKSAIQDPIFLSMMQPLSSHLRLKAHTIVKGIMDPFALAFSGFMLYGLLKFSNGVDLMMLDYLLIGLLIVWVIMIFIADKEYVNSLVTALNRRYTIGQEINLEEEGSQKVLRNKLANGDKGEALYALHLLNRYNAADKAEMIIQALQHPAEEVKVEALKTIEQLKLEQALPEIEKILTGTTHETVMAEAIKAKCMLLPDELESFDELIDSPNPVVTKAALTGLMKSGGINAVVTAGQKLLQLIESAKTNERKLAAEIIGELGISSFYKPLVSLMGDSDISIVKAAIESAGRVGNEKLLPHLLVLLHKKELEKYALYALANMGDTALPGIKSFMAGNIHPRLKTKLIVLLGRMGTEKSTALLNEWVWALRANRHEIIHALQVSSYSTPAESAGKHISLINEYLLSAGHILNMLNKTEGLTALSTLHDALQLELEEIKKTLLVLFSFVFDKEKMIKARNGFLQNKKESVANALEILEISLPKEISARFVAIYEQGNVSDRVKTLGSHFSFTYTLEEILNDVINDKSYIFHRWTKAAALYSLKHADVKNKHQWLDTAAMSDDILIKETAEKILA